MGASLDLAIFIGFLVVNLAVGLYYGRGITNIREYTLGNRDFSTATIAATVIATWLSGASFTITTAETYSKGLYYIIPSLGDAMSFFITAYFYIPRMKEFLGQLSIAEAMGSIYDKRIRGITAISGIFPVIGNVAMQFCILSALLNHAFGISSTYALLISTFVIVTYSTFGGIKAITFTDLIQFFTFGVVILIIALIIWNSLTTPQSIFDFLSQSPLFDYKSVFNYRTQDFWQRLFYFLFLMIPGIDSAIFQRISMSRNTAQASKAFIIAGLFIILCDLLVNTFIGILLIMDNATALDSVNVVGYIMDTYLFSGLKGLFIIGIVAMIMSTADSYINSSAVLLAYDGCQCIGLKLSERKQLLLVKFASVSIALASLTISLFAKDLLDMVLSAYSFYMPIVSVPLILAIFGFRSSSKAVLIGMGAGFITVISVKILSEIDAIIPGMIANTILFMGSHYILGEQGGWSNSKDGNRQYASEKANVFIQSVRLFSIKRFCISAQPKEEKFYVYFGLFSVISILSNALSLSQNIQYQHVTLFSFTYCFVFILSTLFITYPLLPERLKHNFSISILWNIAVFYNLAFSPSLIVFINDFNSIQITILITSLVTLAILLRWQSAMIMIIASVLSSFYCYKIYMGITIEVASVQFKFIYALLLLSSMLIAFLKPKQEQQELIENKNEHLSGRLTLQESQVKEALALREEFIRNVNHEYHAPMTGVISTAESLSKSYDKLTDKQRKMAADSIYKSATKLQHFDDNINFLSKLSQDGYRLNLEQLNLSELLHTRIDICRKLYEENKEDREFILNIDDNIIFNGDRKYLQQALDNLMMNTISYCNKGKITVSLTKSQAKIHLTIEDEGIGIPQDELKSIFAPFIVSSKTRTPAGGRGLGLTLCRKIIEVHSGFITAESDGTLGATFRIVLPC